VKGEARHGTDLPRDRAAEGVDSVRPRRLAGGVVLAIATVPPWWSGRGGAHAIVRVAAGGSLVLCARAGRTRGASLIDGAVGEANLRARTCARARALLVCVSWLVPREGARAWAAWRLRKGTRATSDVLAAPYWPEGQLPQPELQSQSQWLDFPSHSQLVGAPQNVNASHSQLRSHAS